MIIRGILYLPTNQVKVTWASYFQNTMPNLAVGGGRGKPFLLCVERIVQATPGEPYKVVHRDTYEQGAGREIASVFSTERHQGQGIGVGVGPAKGMSRLKLLKLGSLFTPEGVRLHLHTEALKERILNVEFTQ